MLFWNRRDVVVATAITSTKKKTHRLKNSDAGVTFIVTTSHSGSGILVFLVKVGKGWVKKVVVVVAGVGSIFLPTTNFWF